MSAAQHTTPSASTEDLAARSGPGARTGGFDAAPVVAGTTPTGPVVQQRRLVTEIPGPRSRELLKQKTAAVSAGVAVALPAFIARASGGILVDVDDNQLIDLGSGVGVTGVGNANPLVIDAAAEQLKKFTHTAFFVTPYAGYVEVCARLNELTPGTHDKRSALFNSGAEAVENAVKVARVCTGRQAVVVLENGYHGRTNLTLAMTAKVVPFKQGFGPFSHEVYRVPGSYPFRDDLTGPVAAEQTIAHILTAVGAANVAAVVVEPVQGEGGIIDPAPGYLPAIAEYCRENGIVFVADEIQSGFCRTGDWFAVEHEGVVPDLVVTGKGIAGGLPLAAVTGRAELMDAVPPGGLGGTYSGNPVVCAAALGAIEWMRATNAWDRARTIGDLLDSELLFLQGRFPEIGDVRGRGAMKAIEVVRPRSAEPDAALARELSAYCHRNGVVTLVTGMNGNVIRFLPPLSIPDELLIEGLVVLGDAFSAATGR